MTKEEIDIIRGLRNKGYATVLISPQELGDASPHKVEDRLIEISWDIIHSLSGDTDDN